MATNLFDSMYKPDVLSCLADLSNDEVMTPPSVANQMLDLLPKKIWKNPNIKILDPAVKSGVFLREAAKRFIEGEAEIFPDLQERINHIFTEQLYGVAITEMTSLLSRRSLYCSKYPNGPFSIVPFDNPSGNIRFVKTKHTWKNGKCEQCGAAQSEYQRDDSLESHAYEFIHKLKPEEIFNMKFDVIISNPPYQLSDGGGEGSSAIPLYNKFIEQAMKLNPKYLSMIVPARWYSGGKGLDEFRNNLLHDERLSVIHDYPETADCFPGLNIRGGICYFLWDRNHKGDTTVVNHFKGEDIASSRPLLEENANTFIRYNKAVSIVRKVQALSEETMDSVVESRNYYGIPSNFKNYTEKKSSNNQVKLYRSDRNPKSPKEVWINKPDIGKNIQDIIKHKVIVSKASPGGDEFPHSVISLPKFASAPSACTETYLIVSFVDDEKAASSLMSYMATRFFRFMVMLVKNTQNISKDMFSFVPTLKWDHLYSDDELYKKYNLNNEEIAFIESMVRPMELNNGEE